MAPWRARGARPGRGPGRSSARRARAAGGRGRRRATVAAGESSLGEHLVGARADVGGALAAGAAVAPQVPAGAPRVDLDRGQPLVVAVVPLAAAPRAALPRSPRARTARTFPARAAAGCTSTSAKRIAQSAGASAARRLAPVLGERDVGAARVAARRRLHSVSAWRTSTTSARRCPAVRSSRVLPRRGGVVGDHGQALAPQQAGGYVAASARRASRDASALLAPVASSRQLRAARSTARLSVMRSGGGLGESCTPRHSGLRAASSVRGAGEQRGDVPVGRRCPARPGRAPVRVRPVRRRRRTRSPSRAA